MADLYSDSENTMRQEIQRLREIVRGLNDAREAGRNYLMSTPADELTPSAALEAFQFSPDGVEDLI